MTAARSGPAHYVGCMGASTAPAGNADSSNAVLARLERVDNLPTLPEVVTRLEAMLGDPDAGLRQVAALVEQDPAVSAAVLKIVNSPLYRPASTRECSDIFSAIRRLGTAALRNIVMTSALLAAFSSSESQAFDRREFWRHSISVGITGQAIFEFCAPDEPSLSKDVLHLAGILHDLGKIILDEHAPTEFRQAIERATTESLPLHRVEREGYDLDHAIVGAWLCRRWGLPEMLCDVVQYHHTPELLPQSPSRTLARIIHMANYVAHLHSLGASGNPVADYLPDVPTALGLDMSRLSELMDAVETEASKSEILLALT